MFERRRYGDHGFALLGVESGVEGGVPLPRRRPGNADVSRRVRKDEIQGIATFGESRESSDFVEGVMHFAYRKTIQLKLNQRREGRVRLQAQLRDAFFRQMEKDVVLSLFLDQGLKGLWAESDRGCVL